MKQYVFLIMFVIASLGLIFQQEKITKLEKDLSWEQYRAGELENFLTSSEPEPTDPEFYSIYWACTNCNARLKIQVPVGIPARKWANVQQCPVCQVVP
jgi:rubrerythrin